MSVDQRPYGRWSYWRTRTVVFHKFAAKYWTGQISLMMVDGGGGGGGDGGGGVEYIVATVIVGKCRHALDHVPLICSLIFFFRPIWSFNHLMLIFFSFPSSWLLLFSVYLHYHSIFFVCLFVVLVHVWSIFTTTKKKKKNSNHTGRLGWNRPFRYI